MRRFVWTSWTLLGLAIFFPPVAQGARGPFQLSTQEEAHAVQDSRPTNRLAQESSPYLLQHAHNPVDWYPWGEEAFEVARREDKPVFLSIGYSACHWCHVMERESFENEEIAKLMNELFVCVKVDREEHPEVDELYMKAVQALTGAGGWPLSVWLLPDGRPFYGGTYYPPTDNFGRPGFPKVCRRMAELYKDDRDTVEQGANGLTDHLKKLVRPAGGGLAPFGRAVLDTTREQLLGRFDGVHGGFGGAPKFPHPMEVSFLLWEAAVRGDEKSGHAALFSLEKMAAGGMHDQLAGGFHRYSVDDRWLVPHFEKMLYDNALLAQVYLEGWLLSNDQAQRQVVRTTLDYVLEEMTAPEGPFYSSQDADSEGEEGRFFVWDPAELTAVLGEEDGALAAAWYGVAPGGNFEHGKSVLHRPHQPEAFAAEHGMTAPEWAERLDALRRRLLESRETRVHPGRDEKVLLDWNGMMITAMARAGFHLQEPRYVQAARRAAEFLWAELRHEEGLWRTWKSGKARLDANLGDYAHLIEGLLALYQAEHDPRDLVRARQLAQETLDRFWDEEEGGFFFTHHGHQGLFARSKDAYDGATPSASSVHVGNLLALSELLGELSWREKAERTLAVYRRILDQQPAALTRMIADVAFLLAQPREIVLAAPSREAAEPFLEVLRTRLGPARVVLLRTTENAEALEAVSPLVAGKVPVNGQAAAYVCRDFTCEAPVTDPAELARLLDEEN